VFFNSVFEIFVLKVCVLKQFQKMTVYVENVDFRKTHQAWKNHQRLTDLRPMGAEKPPAPDRSAPFGREKATKA
jgi:hypothetical protein